MPLPLHTPRLILRPFDDKDLPAFIARKGATETSGWLAEFATSSARATAVRGAA